MTNSRLDNASDLVPRRVRGYASEGGKIRNAEFTSDT
jgi:hypothetical protein